jgi:hypothetical protein
MIWQKDCEPKLSFSAELLATAIGCRALVSGRELIVGLGSHT